MSPAPPRIVIQTPAPELRFSRGFYQVEEDSLYVPFYPARTFFSYLDSDQVSLQTDNKGQLVFLQLLLPRASWNVTPKPACPEATVTADIRLLDFREQLPKVTVETTADKSTVRLAFAAASTTAAYRLTDSVMCEVTPDARLAAFWITEIEDDRAAAGMAAWRKQMKTGTTLPADEKSSPRRRPHHA